MAKSKWKGTSGLSPDTKTLKSGTITLPPGSIPSPSGGKSHAFDFSQALLSGNPVAIAAAEKAMETEGRFVTINAPPKDEPSLADKFVSSSYEWSKYFKFTAKEDKAVQPVVTAYRQAMRQAHRFQLDPDFVRYATEVSSTCKPEKLLYRLQYATLPYEKTWIEFDLNVKVETMRRFHGLEPKVYGVAPRCGLLLERVDDQMSTVTIVNEAPNLGDITTPNFTGYLFSLDERHLPYTRTYNGLTPFDMDARFRQLSAMKDFADVLAQPDAQEIMRVVTRGSMWGYAGKEGSGIVDNPHSLINQIKVPLFLERHGEAAFSRFYDFFEFAKGEAHSAMPHLVEFVNREMVEFSGMMRWVVCVLAMLNEVPIRTDLIKPMHTMRAGLTRRVPAFDYHRVTLRLPKTKPVPWIERHLSNVERKHKAHEVMQHWRTYVKEGACPRDTHEWEYDYNEGYRLCGKCMSFSRLIHEHVRGDPSLGWVRKEYLVKPVRQP